MTTDPLIARLAAANPVPASAPPIQIAARPPLRRRVFVAALAAAAIAVPALALADGGLFGLSTQGQTVASSDTPFAQDTGLNDAMQQLGFPSTLQLLDQRDGISFYVARRDDGSYCFAVQTTRGKGVGCDLGSPAGAKFPSPQRPIMDFSQFSDGAQLAGFAADGVASVALVDATGNVLATAPVVDNVYAGASPPAGGAGVEALDASGAVVYQRQFGQAP